MDPTHSNTRTLKLLLLPHVTFSGPLYTLPNNCQNYTANVSYCIVQFKKQLLCSDQYKHHLKTNFFSSRLPDQTTHCEELILYQFQMNFFWFFLVSPPFLHFISYWPFFLLNTPKWWNYRVQIFVTWIAIDTIILDPILDVRAVQVAREDHWVICQYMTKCPFDIYIARFKG